MNKQLIDMLSEPWLVKQEWLDTLVLELGQLPAEAWYSERDSKPPVVGIDVDAKGVARIAVHGPITKRPMRIGWEDWTVGAEDVASAFKNALSMPSIRAIVLDIDSPGGTVDGTAELADIVLSGRGVKPIIAVANGLMASAAYWIGSAADKIVAGNTTEVGSIGVALAHFDISEFYKKVGITKTYITAGKYKRLTGENEPLSAEGKAYLQEFVDDIYELFVTAVSKHRGVSKTDVLRMADGKTFIGRKALDMGLVDIIGGVKAVEKAIKERSKIKMDLNTIKEQHPDLYAEIVGIGVGQGKADAESKIVAARAEGQSEERKRVVTLLKAGADNAATLAAIETGMSEGEAFKAFFTAEKARTTAKLEALEAYATPALQICQPLQGADTFEVKVEKLVQAGKTRGQAITAVVAEYPKLHQEYLSRVNAEGKGE